MRAASLWVILGSKPLHISQADFFWTPKIVLEFFALGDQFGPLWIGFGTLTKFHEGSFIMSQLGQKIKSLLNYTISNFTDCSIMNPKNRFRIFSHSAIISDHCESASWSWRTWQLLSATALGLRRVLDSDDELDAVEPLTSERWLALVPMPSST